MSKSIKLKNNTYWDSKGISHNNKLLSDILYPVGSVYMSVNSTSPATLFGGTWTQISGRFLYCTTTSKTTGGASTHTHTQGATGSATGNTGATTLTTNQIPAHSHSGTTGLGYTSFMRAVGNVGTDINANHIPSYSGGAYVDCSGHAYPRWKSRSRYYNKQYWWWWVSYTYIKFAYTYKPNNSVS